MNTLESIAVCTCTCLGSFCRPAYRQLFELPEHFPGIPIIVLSATIVPSALEQLRLTLPGCVVVKGSVNRPNIYLEAENTRE